MSALAYPRSVRTSTGDVYLVAHAFTGFRVLVNFGGAYVLMHPTADGQFWEQDPIPASVQENRVIQQLTSAYTDKTQVTPSTSPAPDATPTEPELPSDDTVMLGADLDTSLDHGNGD